MNIDDFYKKVVCGELLGQEPEMNRRTGVATRSLPGVTFQTDLGAEGFPLLSLRKMPMSFIAEQVWFCSGSNKIAWLSKHTRIWDFFAEKDGTVSSAYGYRWRNWFKVDQLETVLRKLRADPSSRQCVVMMWDPEADLTVPQKNVPCPYTFTLNIIGGRLHLHLTVRSNDMILGAPTDIAGFALLQMMLAQELGVPAGVYTHSISNCHIYENQLYVARELKDRLPQAGKVEIALPRNSYKRALLADDELVAEIRDGVKGYEPSPSITGIPIAI